MFEGVPFRAILGAGRPLAMHLLGCLLLCLNAYGGEKTKKLGTDLDG